MQPIIVLRRNEPHGCEKQFELVSGAGRLQILVALGKAAIPTFIIEGSCEELEHPARVESADEGTAR
jgi:ParB-like chromosome segregation protein Spo0J